MEAKETSPLVRAFARARKDVVERMSGVDFAPMTPEEADAKWQRAEQEVLLETNRAHDWRHRHSPWFRLYYHFFWRSFNAVAWIAIVTATGAIHKVKQLLWDDV
jgi:hypothetical protein